MAEPIIIRMQPATHCATCGAEYVYIEHPLRRGVPMMSKCECPPPTVETIGATTIIRSTSRPRT